MTLPPIKLWHVLALILAALVAGFFYWYNSWNPSFRYRLTVELNAHGKTLTASSIIEAHYKIGSDGNGLRFHADVRGVAPIFDLGPDGTLIAALSYDAADLSSRQIAKNGFPAYRMPTDAAHIPLQAFGVPPEAINGAKGQVELDFEFYPAFVWIPAQTGWQNARQMFYEEIPGKIGAHIRVAKIVVEPARWETVNTRIDPAPTWLISMKNGESRRNRPNGQFNFISSYVEKGH